MALHKIRNVLKSVLYDSVNGRQLELESDNSVPVTVKDSGVPASFSKISANGDSFLVQKSNLNKFRLRPQIPNEHAESSRNVVSTVTATNIVGQIFKASQDNINGLDFTCRATQDVDIDDFESYANDAALQSVWVASGSNLAELETSIVHEGSQAMYLDGDGTIGDEWVMTIASTDLTGATGSLFLYSRKEYRDVKLRFFIGDGTNTKSAPLVIQLKEDWEEIEVPENILVEDGAGTTDPTAITKVGLRLEKDKRDGDLYVDLLSAAVNPGSLNIKLWNMGASIPVSGTTKINDGAQYTKLGDAGITGLQASEVTVDLIGGVRQYHVDGFVAGPALEIPANEILIPNNYYAITFNYVDAEIEIYGPNPAWDNYYENGYSFDAVNESTAIVGTGTDEDLQFIIYSTQDVYINRMVQIADASPGLNSSVLTNVEDYNMRITDIVNSGIVGLAQVDRQFDKPYFMAKGGKFETNYNDDPEDSVSVITFNFQYFFEPNGTHG